LSGLLPFNGQFLLALQNGKPAVVKVRPEFKALAVHRFVVVN